MNIDHVDHKYRNLVKAIVTDGFNYLDDSRAGIQMREIPHYVLDIDIIKGGFPLLTTKKIYWKSVIHELIWMLSGSTNIDYLVENKVNIWNEDANNYSGGTTVGRIYGAQWRSWDFQIDQIANLIEGLKTNIHSRRHLVTAWNPSELEFMALPPCHWAFQVMPTATGFALKWQQRSCDVFLGVPFDIVLYATLGKLIEHATGLVFERLIGSLSCAHIYEPHVEALTRQMKNNEIAQKTELIISEKTNINNLSISDFTVNNYDSAGPIKAKMYAKVINSKD